MSYLPWPTVRYLGPDKRRRGRIFEIRIGDKAPFELYVSNQGKRVRMWDREKGREL